jgi:hypothetical protein
MPYVSRDAAGRVVAVAEQQSEGLTESLPADHADVLDYLVHLGEGSNGAGRFLASDLAFIRVMEDLIEVLVRKRLLAFTDLPGAAQEKLLERRSLRSYLGTMSGVFGSDEGKII